MIVGLGNPGKQYARSKHNIGWMVLDEWMQRHRLPPARLKFEALLTEQRVGSERILLVKPMTYMNASGRAVRAVADYFHIPAEDILVICDDIDLDFGSIRMRPNGGAGTHNGMRDILAQLQTRDFPRMRLGINDGRPRGDLAEFVLGDFPAVLQPELDQLIARAADALDDYIEHGLHYSMNRNNG